MIEVDVASFRDLARSEGIRDEAYILEGEDYALRPETHPSEYVGVYVLRREGDTWVVFGSERGQHLGSREYENEDDACQELMAQLLRDDTTRG